MKKRFLLAMASIIIIALLFSACAGLVPSEEQTAHPEEGAAAPVPAEVSQDEHFGGDPEAGSGEGFMPDTEDSASTAEIAEQMGSKLIKSGYMSVETVDFVETTSAITRRVQQAGGFIASSNVEGWSREDARYKPLRRASYKIRIPSEKFEQFMTDIGDMGNVTISETWGEDVTEKYFDTEARLKSLTMQEERLLTLLSKAEKLADIIEIERELSSVRYQIENLTGTLRKYDNLVAYSTLELDVVEVEEITELEEKPADLWQKIAQSFRNSIKSVMKMAESLLLFLVAAVPYLLLFGIIFIIILGIYKFTKLKIKKYQKGVAAGKKSQVRQEEKTEDKDS
ncbi:MAG: DUF4349 domain-containing protein [Clostridiales bacterium]|jgi:hypothetical protein|nr:DUF4349 domain-containing protein [Clostridiales bacterium]